MTNAIEQYARVVCSKAWVTLSVHAAPIFGYASGQCSVGGLALVMR